MRSTPLMLPTRPTLLRATKSCSLRAVFSPPTLVVFTEHCYCRSLHLLFRFSPSQVVSPVHSSRGFTTGHRHSVFPDTTVFSTRPSFNLAFPVQDYSLAADHPVPGPSSLSITFLLKTHDQPYFRRRLLHSFHVTAKSSVHNQLSLSFIITSFPLNRGLSLHLRHDHIALKR